MNHPQTFAEKMYKEFPTKKLRSIKDYGCCAFTFMWCMGYEPDDINAIFTVSSMIDKGVIGADCTVIWDAMSQYITGRKCKAEFIDITSIGEIKERTPVKYERSYIDRQGNRQKDLVKFSV